MKNFLQQAMRRVSQASAGCLVAGSLLINPALVSAATESVSAHQWLRCGGIWDGRAAKTQGAALIEIEGLCFGVT